MRLLSSPARRMRAVPPSSRNAKISGNSKAARVTSSASPVQSFRFPLTTDDHVRWTRSQAACAVSAFQRGSPRSRSSSDATMRHDATRCDMMRHNATWGSLPFCGSYGALCAFETRQSLRRQLQASILLATCRWVHRLRLAASVFPDIRWQPEKSCSRDRQGLCACPKLFPVGNSFETFAVV